MPAGSDDRARLRWACGSCAFYAAVAGLFTIFAFRSSGIARLLFGAGGAFFGLAAVGTGLFALLLVTRHDWFVD